MTQNNQPRERRRRDWLLILLILLLGFLCVFLAGQWAVRFAPNFRLDAGMDSNIDPNSLALTNQPDGPIEPLDPNILTPPAWLSLFLTPGALGETNNTATPFATPISTTPVASLTPIATLTTITSTVVPSNTPVIVYIPPTNTPNPPPPVVVTDLQITKDDGAATYLAGSSTNYTIIVTNNGPNDVVGATISDAIPAQIASWTWTCTTVVNASGCDGVIGSTANFNDTFNIQNGGSIQYTVSATYGVSVSGDLANSASVSVPSGYVDTNNSNSSATDTNTYVASTDLSITKTDGVIVYEASDILTYTVTVTNNGPDNVVGAVVSDNRPTQIATWSWACTTVTSASGCDALGGSAANFTDTVDIQSGGSIVYTVTANVSGSPSGNLVNTAAVTAPGGVTELNNTNNSATDTDQLATGFPGTLGSGSTPTGAPYHQMADNAQLVLSLPTAVVIDGSAGYEIVYYEEANGPGIALDWVMIEIGDGTTWYPVFAWGDGVSDANTNVAIPLAGNGAGDGPCTGEPDNCSIDGALLLNSTGITIDVDGLAPNGTYPYLRITAWVPSGGGDGGVDMDGIYIVP